MQTIVNLGTGGADLNGQNGSTTSADSNDALFLDWPGDNAGNYVYLPGVNGNYLSVPDEAALDITGDIDIRILCVTDTLPATRSLVAKYETSGNQRQYQFTQQSTGVLQFVWSADGVVANVVSSTQTIFAAGYSSGDPVWLRVTFDVDNGASGNDVEFFWSSDGSSWTQVGATVTTAGVASLFDGSGTCNVGARGNSGIDALPAKIYRAQVLDGIDGTTVLDVDCSQITSGSATSFTALTGQTVTINRSTSGRKSVAVVSPVWLFGTDDYMQVAANALLGADPSQDFTAMIIHRVWDTPASNAAKLSTAIIATGSGDQRRGWGIRQLTTTYQTQSFWQDDSTGGTDTLDAGLAASSGALSAFGFVVDRGEQKIRGFSELGLDSGGADITSVTSTVTPNVFRIGRWTRVSTAYSDMEVIGVAVFRRALSFSEISQVYSYYQNRAA